MRRVPGLEDMGYMRYREVTVLTVLEDTCTCDRHSTGREVPGWVAVRLNTSVIRSRSCSPFTPLVKPQSSASRQHYHQGLSPAISRQDEVGWHVLQDLRHLHWARGCCKTDRQGPRIQVAIGGQPHPQTDCSTGNTWQRERLLVLCHTGAGIHNWNFRTRGLRDWLDPGTLPMGAENGSTTQTSCRR
jgi:hypothetical protein